MLAIRMQRTGRKGHAMFRLIVQDSRRTPTSGKIVASLGSYDPHAKSLTLDKEKASFYLEHGAQPSDRTARLLKEEGVKLPDWVTVDSKQKRAVRNPDKRRSTSPVEAVEPAAPVAEEAVVPEVTETPASEQPVESDTVAETAAEPKTETIAEPTPEAAETTEVASASADNADKA
jgi:small subunit ribosomal protein S16